MSRSRFIWLPLLKYRYTFLLACQMHGLDIHGCSSVRCTTSQTSRYLLPGVKFPAGLALEPPDQFCHQYTDYRKRDIDGSQVCESYHDTSHAYESIKLSPKRDSIGSYHDYNDDRYNDYLVRRHRSNSLRKSERRQFHFPSFKSTT